MSSDRVAKSIKLSAIADSIIEKLRVIPQTNRKKSYNSVIEELIEKSPAFKKALRNFTF